MNVLILVSPGLENIGKTEIQEYEGKQNKNNTFALSPEQLSQYCKHAQTPRRIIVVVSEAASITELKVDKVPWSNFLPTPCVLKLVVENVKGQDNRSTLSRELLPLLLPALEKAGIKATLEMKKPDSTLILAKEEHGYVLGLDLCGEINSRPYRVFPHSASFKGDLAYYLIRKAKVEPGKKFLVGFAKDGAIGIEAALYINHVPVRELNRSKISLLAAIPETVGPKPEKTIIDLFESTLPTINAIRKNSYIAKVQDHLKVIKCDLDELDVKYEEKSFDSVLFHLTSKDEDKINELYYQADYILKQGGLLLFFTRDAWELSISSKFKLLEKEKILRGENYSLLWVLQKV